MMNTETQRTFSDAKNKMFLGDYEAALECLSSLKPLQNMDNPRILSYYGLCLVKARSQLFDGLRICQDALAMERRDPDIYYNLAQVYLLCGKRKSAVNLLYRGLEYEMKVGYSKKILKQIQGLVSRRPPFCKWLSRNHPVNKYMGKLTYARINRIRRAEIHHSENRARFTDYLFLPLVSNGGYDKIPKNKLVYR